MSSITESRPWARPVTGLVLNGPRKSLVYTLLGLVLLLAGSVFAIDWAVYLYGIPATLYPGIGKPCITLLCLLMVFFIGRYHLDPRDLKLLLLAFLCMFPTDILMSAVALLPDTPVDSPVFMAGGVLSIVAHVFLAIRHGRGFPYFRKEWKASHPDETLLNRLWLPLIIYGSAVLLIGVLWKDIVRVGHHVIGPVYTAFFCTSTWFAWETVRYRLYPKPNAWMAALAMTFWYLTEIIGEIYNIGIGTPSQIAFRVVWVFYGTNVVLLALSGFRWNEKE
ncbi:MAG TPA: hypothetical protein ENN21_02920 [Spirochaetes bacterium]|nr:hypothetical protein [Spirochaetota bacterium]